MCMPGGHWAKRHISLAMRKEIPRKRGGEKKKCNAGVSHEQQKLVQWQDEEVMYFVICYRRSCWEERINQLGFYLKAKCCTVLTK